MPLHAAESPSVHGLKGTIPMNDLVAGIVEGLELTKPFYGQLPAKTRPMTSLWAAHEKALHALRMPLYYSRLGKPKPKPAAYDQAVQSGLAIAASFARIAGSQRVIIPVRNGIASSISIQPRPWQQANWTAEHGLSSGLVEPCDDPMTADDPNRLPRVSTSDVMHLMRKVALAFVSAQDICSFPGTVTIEFTNDRDQPSARMIFKPFDSGDHMVRREALQPL
jgi:hypothetical protein